MSKLTSIKPGLTNTFVLALAVNGSDLFAGISGGGVWRRSLSEMNSSVEGYSVDLPTGFTLNQNSPNPFNPTTTITYQIPKGSFVSLKVYDVLGNEVATLVNKEKPVGNYELVFDATELSSGFYFYKLQAGGFIATKEMLVIK